MIQQPLSVYIIKHPKYTHDLDLAKYIYSEICRDIDDPSIIKSNIPVYFTDNRDSDEQNQLEINFDQSKKTAIIIIVDNQMILDFGNGWHEYINSLIQQITDSDSVRIFPIALNENVMKQTIFENSLNKLNFIRLYEHTDSANNGMDYLIMEIRHELCRMLFNLESVKDANKETGQPVKIFLSHAKADGTKITKAIRNFINENSAIEDFFDSVDIQKGKDFEKEINSSIEQSKLLLIIHTDKYVNSEWCKMEVLTAKKYDIPILVVECLTNGELRSFPYLGNTKSIRFYTDSEGIGIEDMAQKVISSALEEVLYKQSYRTSAESLFENFKQSSIKIQNNTPELLTMGCIANNDNIIYPEPPLGRHELEILNERYKGINLLTPIMFYSKTSNLQLNNYHIALSVSESVISSQKGICDVHAKEFIIELTRYLLNFGATIMYGGFLGYKSTLNILETLANVSRAYSKDYARCAKIKNYVAHYLQARLVPDIQVQYLNEIEFEFLPEKDNDPASDLTEMRLKIANDMDAAIFAGGKMHGYTGRCQGVLEEFMLALEKKKPIFILGTFGGICEKICDAIDGKDQYFATDAFNTDLPTEKDKDSAFYSQIISTMATIKHTSLNNGLTEEENKQLMTTTNYFEAISLILRGLEKVVEF